MKLISGARYRHKNCLDVDFEIEKVKYRGNKYTIVNIAYLNRNWENGEFLILRESNVKISNQCLEYMERIR